MFTSFVLSALLQQQTLQSGVEVGEYMAAYEPHHVSGPDRGTEVCPVCKYGKLPAVQVWLNGERPESIKKIADLLDSRVAKSKRQFKAFLAFMVDDAAPARTLADGTMVATTSAKVKELYTDTYPNVAMTYLPKQGDAQDAYKVSLSDQVTNTIFVYKDMKLVKKFVNFVPDERGLADFKKALNQVDRQ